MLSEEKLEKILATIEGRIDEVNTFYLKKVGEQINAIGKLSPASIHKLIQIRNAGTTIDEINKALQKATQKNLTDVNALYEQALKETYTDNALTALARGIPVESLAQNQQMRTVLESINRVTAQKLMNFSNTTNVSTVYKELVSDAVQAALSGVGDYNSAIRSKWEQAALNGLRVTYESGVTRRLDTAIRMNVIDGVKHIQQEAQHIIGEKIGADGVEITAHPNSAKDHEPCQGRQFTKAEYEKMQSGAPFYDVDEKLYQGFNRPIGEWNCTHFAFDIVLGVSKRRYSDVQLEAWRKANNEGCEIDGEHYTKYEATQLMRKMETAMRRQKDLANAAKASGDDVLRRKAQKNLMLMTAKYKAISDKSGLETRFQRTFVSGFKDVKLQNGSGSGIINTLPNADKAIIPAEKFTRYALNYERAPNKAAAFEKALGYTSVNAEKLVENIRNNLGFYSAVKKPDNGYGQRFEVLMPLIGENGKTANVKTAWIVDSVTGETRLTSAYITEKGRRKNDS